MNGILIWIRLFQGLSDVATILARRVAVEFSDSDDGPSDSEYDSDDWGEIMSYKTLKLLILNLRRDGCLTARASTRPAEQQHTASNQLQVTPWPDNTLAIINDPQYYQYHLQTLSATPDHGQILHDVIYLLFI